MKEICIDIRELSDGQKSLAQEAFFKLGYMWCVNGKRVIDLADKVHIVGNTDGSMWHVRSGKRTPTHTFDQLVELADMPTEPKQFTKADLKDGVIVTYRNGDERIIYNGNFYRAQTNDEVSEWVFSSGKTNAYNEKGFSIKVPGLDIVKVVYMGEIIWERPEPKPKPTAEQLRINTLRTKIEYLTNELKELECVE